MARYSRHAFAVTLLAVFQAGSAWPQAALPSDFDMSLARQRIGEALRDSKLPKDVSRPAMPSISALPKPVAKSPDIATIAEAYRQYPPTRVAGAADIPELMVFVSLSMPKEALERVVLQSEKSGAVLVLRGLKGNSLTQMGEELARVIGKHNVSAIIHPPAFKQFNVTQVPALVLARSGEATRIGEDGCAAPASYIKVAGDVSQDYALDLIERQAPAWADVSRRFAARLTDRP